MKRFFWEKVPLSNQIGRLGRAHFAGSRVMPVHDHSGFAEVFWVNSGRGVHTLNGRRMTLETGDVVFIREPDQHGFTGHGATGLALTNLAMEVNAVRYLRDRYFAPGQPAETPGGFWHPAADPRIFRLSPAALQEVDDAGERLSLRSSDPLEIDRFILNLASKILDTAGDPRGFPDSAEMTEPPPPWLRRALRKMEDHRPVETLSVARLVAACDRSPEHVARVMRRCTGLTPSAWLRRLRIRWAAHLLDMTNRSVTDIALDCGFTGISYFYKAFHEEYQISPTRFRRSLGG